MGVDPAPETLRNAELELHSVLVTRLAHWGQKGVNWCEAEVREQNCDHILDNRQQTHLVVIFPLLFLGVVEHKQKHIPSPRMWLCACLIEARHWNTLVVVAGECG